MYCIWLNNHWITISLGIALNYNLLVVFFCQLCTYLKPVHTLVFWWPQLAVFIGLYFLILKDFTDMQVLFSCPFQFHCTSDSITTLYSNRVTSENKRICTPLPCPCRSKLGCLLFSIGSLNIGTTLHGGDEEGKAILPPVEFSKM